MRGGLEEPVEDVVARALACAQMCEMIFEGERPSVRGGALAELLATFVHEVEHTMRAELLAKLCATVWKLVALADSEGQREQ